MSEPPNQRSHTGDVLCNTAFEGGRQPRSNAFSSKVKRQAIKEMYFQKMTFLTLYATEYEAEYF